jgi:repressor LexA
MMDKQERPTKKQFELLEFVGRFVSEHGYGPSYREIMNGCNYSSVATVALHVNNLIKKGHLKKKDRSARSLEVVDSPVDEGQKITSQSPSGGQEKWLISLIEKKFDEAEQTQPDQNKINELSSLVSALRTLGFSSSAQEFAVRLGELQQK